MKKELQIKKQVDPIIDKAFNLNINDQTFKTGLNYLSKAKSQLKELTQDKKKLTDPINASLKAIRLKYAPFEASLSTAIDLLSDKISVYQTALKNENLMEKEKIASKVESGYIKVDTAIAKLDELQIIEKKIDNTTFVSTPKFEVTDLLLVPIEYHLANEVAIRRAMLAGIQLPGVKYWTEERPRENKKKLT